MRELVSFSSVMIGLDFNTRPSYFLSFFVALSWHVSLMAEEYIELGASLVLLVIQFKRYGIMI